MADVVITNDEITDALTRLSAALSDMTPIMDEIGEILTFSTKKRFGEGVSPDGVAWAPKSKTTLERYGARASNKIDIRPLFGPSKQLNSQISHISGPDSVEWGSPRVYAAAMHFGAAKGAFGPYSGTDKKGRRFSGVAPWGNIPARPFLGISTEDATNILDTISEALTRAAAPG